METREKKEEIIYHEQLGVPVIEKYILPENPNLKLVWVGNLAAGISIVSALYFIIRLSILKTTATFSYIWLLGVMLTSSLWLIYGLKNKLQPTILSSSLLIMGYLYLIIFKIIVEANGWASHQRKR